MRRHPGFRFWAVLLVVFAITACSQQPAPAKEPAFGEAMILATHPVRLQVEGAAGKSFSVEIAGEAFEQSAGLMFRRKMADDHGMLFVFPRSRPASFWMMNTVMPLDIVFIRENGTVANIVQGEPFSTDPLNSAGNVRYVLEVKAGIAEKSGIAPGTRLVHPLIAGH